MATVRSHFTPLLRSLRPSSAPVQPRSLSSSSRQPVSSISTPLFSRVIFCGARSRQFANIVMSGSNSQAKARLSVISRHLQPTPNNSLNTPYSSEQRARQIPAGPKQSIDSSTFSTRTPAKPQVPMSSQAPHPAVLIPGPIEYDDAVLQAMSHYRCVGSR